MSDDFEVGFAADLLLENDDVNSQCSTKANDAVQPCFNYVRVRHGLDAIVSSDCISCIAVHQKFLIVGTYLGRVHVLDHCGFPTEHGLHATHSRPVNQISISDEGDFMVSCADDGKVIIYNLSEPESVQVVPLDHPVKSIAVAPDYSKSQNLVFGYKKLSLLSRGVFKRSRHSGLAEGRGLIHCLRWRGDFIIWVDDEQVGVFVFRDRRPIAYIKFKEQTIELYRRTLPCYVNWQTDTCFVIGRGHFVHVCEVAKRLHNPEVTSVQRQRWDTSASRSSLTTSIGSSTSLSSSVTDSTGSFSGSKGLFNWYVEVTHRFTVPSGPVASNGIAGLSRHQDQLLVLLASTTTHPSTQLMFIDVNNVGSLTVVNREDVLVDGAPNTWPPASPVLSLETIPGENTHYIVSPKLLMCAHEPSADDRIGWLSEHGQHAAALDVAQHNSRSLTKYSVRSVAVAYVDQLLRDRLFKEAGEILSRVSSSDMTLWEEHIVKFMQLSQLQVLVPYLPTSKTGNQLESKLYEMVLMELMNENTVYFYEVLQNYGTQRLITNYDAILSSLTDHIGRITSLLDPSEVGALDNNPRTLLLALAYIYVQMGSSIQAVDLLVRLKEPMVFELISHSGPTNRHRMITEVLRERIVDFMNLDINKTVVLLLDNIEEIPINYVVEQLELSPELLHRYLDSVHSRLPQLAAPYFIRLIQLCIVYAREKLLQLLQSTDRYSLSEALALCQQAHLVKETVYLLTRVGRRQDALKLIMTRGGNTEQPSPQQTTTGPSDARSEEQHAQSAAATAAIAYCREQDFVARRRTISTQPSGEEEDHEGVSGELWLQVVLYAVDKPTFVRTLLQHAGAEGLDARLLLRKLSPDMHIPGLRESLVKLLNNHRLQLDMHYSCANILRADVQKLLARLLAIQARGVRVECNGLSSLSCTRCRQALFPTMHPTDTTGPTSRRKSLHDHQSVDPAILFNCRHLFHRSCLPIVISTMEYDTPKCPMCSGNNDLMEARSQASQA